MKVKVISLPYIFQALYVLCSSRPRYQVSVYRTIGPLVYGCVQMLHCIVPDLIYLPIGIFLKLDVRLIRVREEYSHVFVRFSQISRRAVVR